MDIIDTEMLKTLTVAGARKVVKEAWGGNLKGLNCISDKGAKVLAKCPGFVYLRLKHLTGRQMEILLPKYAAGTLRLLGLYEGDQQMRVAWEEARNNGRWPFRANKKNSAARSRRAHRTDKERRA